MADITIEAGKLLLREGAESDHAYMIESGKVEVFHPLENGEEEHVAFLGPGQIVGEYGVIDDAPRSASVRAVVRTALRYLKIEKDDG